MAQEIRSKFTDVSETLLSLSGLINEKKIVLLWINTI